MMPFGSECCKGYQSNGILKKLLVDLFLESYTRCTSRQGVPVTMEF